MITQIVETTDNQGLRARTSAREDSWSRFEKIVAVSLALSLLVLKIAYCFLYSVDSDETQHLHVVWGWANGFLPYRDLFDNHSPLFQFLCSPVFRLLGERPDIIIPMRALVIPLYVLSLWCTYQCGKALVSKRAGVWAALLTGAYPIFFASSSEFRTDDLWMVFWLLAILALIRRPIDRKGAYLAGLAIGASFATSMKTSVLVISLIAAAGVLGTWKAMRKEPVEWRRIPILVVYGLAGAVIVPTIVICFFWWRGALPDFYACVIQHNLVAGFFRTDILKRLELFAPPALFASIGAYFALTRPTNPKTHDRFALIVLTAVILTLAFGLIWPIIEPHDILPLGPLPALAIVPVFLRIGQKVERSVGIRQSLFMGMLGFVEIAALFVCAGPRLRGVDETTNLISDVLKLTTKDDYVMDAKGESIFRRRAFYHVLEGVTLRRLELGLIKDDIPERLMSLRPPVATILRTPPRARAFIEQNYLPVAFRIRVPGQMLITNKEELAMDRALEIMIPAEYRLVAEQGEIEALLDGQPWSDARFIPVGHHEVRVLRGGGRIALVLAGAVDKGFSPFSPQARDVAKGPRY